MVRKRAFTLLEVVVVIIVLGIASVVAASVVRDQGKQVAGVDAATAVQRVLLAQQSYAAARGEYTSDPSALVGVGRDVQVIDGVSSTGNMVSMHVGAAGDVALAAMGSDGVCYGVVAAAPMAGGGVSNGSPAVCAAESLLA